MSNESEPKNTEKELYIYLGMGEFGSSYISLQSIIDKAREHFGPSFNPENCSIGGEHHHARCLGYDLYDSMDYDNYLVITID